MMMKRAVISQLLRFRNGSFFTAPPLRQFSLLSAVDSARVVATSVDPRLSVGVSRSRFFSTPQPSLFVPLKRRIALLAARPPSFDFDATLKKIVEQINVKEKPFENVMVVAVQHVLGTTVDMFKLLKALGLEMTIVGGKSYSTHQPCVDELKDLDCTFIEAPDQLGYGRFDGCMQETVGQIWTAALKEMEARHKNGRKVDLLIILDDGGDLILSTPGKLFNGIVYKPKQVIGIEQTRGGSNHRCFNGVPFPVINVAGSYVKTTIEYPEVAAIAAERTIHAVEAQAIRRFMAGKDAKKPIIGVVGNGTMGQAIVDKFVSEGYSVLVHDKVGKPKATKGRWYSDLPSLISNADIIIGCTGTDITAEANNLNAILNSVKQKYLVSTSSKDSEFNTLLVYIQEQTKQLGQTPNPLADIPYTNPDDPNGEEIIIFNGGFPINFDQKRHCVSPEKIWPTRAALLGACLMAVNAHHQGLITSADVLKLDPEAQLAIYKLYAELNPTDPCVVANQGLAEDELLQLIEYGSDGVTLEPKPASRLTP